MYLRGKKQDVNATYSHMVQEKSIIHTNTHTHTQTRIYDISLCVYLCVCAHARTRKHTYESK